MFWNENLEKKEKKDMKNKDCKDELFQETVFMLFALDIAAKLAIYGTAAFLILKWRYD